LAGPISEEILAEILSRANIVDVIAEHLAIRKVGNGYQGLCPFHTDSKPSFYVNEARQFFHCFGCGAGGNAFHFLMRFRQMTFPEAVHSLAERHGVQLPQRALSPEERRRRAQHERLLEFNDLAASYYRQVLTGPQGIAARRYLRERGISSETQETFSLGFAPQGWKALVDYLGKQSVNLPLAERAGLIIAGKDGGYYDRFRGRIIFPIYDESGRAVGFGGRTLGEDLPKYLNTPDSPLFAKRKNLYGLHMARKAIREADSTVVVEGYTDLLTLHQFGVRNAVATLGTALTPEHLLIMKRYSPNVVHVFDADEAGDRATLRALDLCLKTGIWGRVFRLPPPHDPDSYVREVGGNAFQTELKKAIPLMDFFIHRVMGQEDILQLEGKTRALKQLLPKLRKLPDRVSQDHYVSIVAQRLHLQEKRIHELLRGDVKAAQEHLQERTLDDPSRAEKLLLQAILKQPSLARCLQGDVLEEFQDPRTKAIGAQLARWADEGVDWEAPSFEASIQDLELGQSLAQLSAHLQEVEDPDKICEDCLKHIKRKGLDRKIHALEEEIALARDRCDDETTRKLENQKVDLVMEKARLRMSA
jgi:DNA primase